MIKFPFIKAFNQPIRIHTFEVESEISKFPGPDRYRLNPYATGMMGGMAIRLGRASGGNGNSFAISYNAPAARIRSRIEPIIKEDSEFEIKNQELDSSRIKDDLGIVSQFKFKDAVENAIKTNINTGKKNKPRLIYFIILIVFLRNLG